MIALLVFASAQLIAAPPPIKIGVFDISTSGVDPTFKESAIDSVAAAVGQVEGYQVLSRSEVNAMLGADKIKESLGCTEISCLAEIGAAAGVNRVVGGSIGKVEAGYVVHLQLIDVIHASVQKRASATWTGPGEELPDVLAAVAETLVMSEEQRMPGRLLLTGVDPQTRLTIDGEPRPKALNRVEGLTVGVHKLRVDKDGYQSWVTAFVIRSGKSKQLDVQLNLGPNAASQEVTTPLYKRWWLWTGLTVLVGGGVAAAVIVAEDHSGKNSNNTNNNGGSLNITVATPQ